MPIQKVYVKRSLKRNSKLEFSPSVSCKGFLAFYLVSGTASPTLRRNAFFFFFFFNCMEHAVLGALRGPAILGHHWICLIQLKGKKKKCGRHLQGRVRSSARQKSLCLDARQCQLSRCTSGSWAAPAPATGVVRKGCVGPLSLVSESALRSSSMRWL